MTGAAGSGLPRLISACELEDLPDGAVYELRHRRRKTCGAEVTTRW